MKIKTSIMKAMLGLAWLGLQAGHTLANPGPVPSGIKINALNVNTTILLELYNQAQQYNGNVTSYPANLDPAVVTASISNPSTASITPCFRLTVKDAVTSCSNQTMVTSPMFTAKKALAPGETRIFTAADFTSSGNYQGQFCQAAQDELKQEFGNVDPSNLSKVVDKFIRRKFTVCLVESDCNNGNIAGVEQGCTMITLFTPNPGAQESVSVLIYPHNNAVADCNINFLWTPAMKPGLSSGDIAYTLEISEQMDGSAFTRIEIPSGQNFYQYGAKDRELTQGKQYYWRVISKNARTGKRIGGPDGSGWNIQKWFRCGASSENNASCRYTLADLQALIEKRGTPDVIKALKGMKPTRLVSPDSFSDPDICKLLARDADLKAINVTKN